MPHRIRLSRARGWRKPEGVIVVARPTLWGNPYRPGDTTASRADAVQRYEDDLRAGRLRFTVDDARERLAGSDLACWCSLDGPCHADVLLRVANDDQA
jgi:hypothetical protein